ncbi:MAG: O-antigen ligase family protein [Candidatus Omnitrophota bacterium]
MTRKNIVSFLDKTVFFLFAVFVFFLPVSNSALEISFSLIAAVMFVRAVLAPPSFEDIKSFFSDRINLAVMVFFVCVGLSLIASGPLFNKSLRAWLFKWGEGVLLFCIVRICLTKKRLMTLLFVLLGAAFLVCVDGLYQKATGADFIRGFTPNLIRGVLPVKACFSHHNDFATFLVSIFFVNFGVFYAVKKNWIKVSSLFLSALIIVNLIFTYSRGAWLAFLAVSLFLMLAAPYRKVKITFFAAMFVFAAVIIFVPLLRERLFNIIQKGGDAGRFYKWTIAMNIFRDYPVFGSGVGLFMDKYAEYTVLGGYHYAHNCYIQILAETGLAGLVTFLWFLSEIIVKAFRGLLKNAGMIGIGLFSGFMSFLIYAFFDTQLYSLKLSLLFWTLAAFLVKSMEKDDIAEKTDRGPAVRL